MLVNIGGDIVITGALEIHKGQMTLQVARYIAAIDHRINLGIDGDLIEQVILGEQIADLQAVGLDMSGETRCSGLLCQRAVKVKLSQRGAYVAVKGQVIGLAVEFAIQLDTATTRDDVMHLGRHSGNQTEDLFDDRRTGIQVNTVKVQGLVTALVRHQIAAVGIERQATACGAHIQDRHFKARTVAYHRCGDMHRVVELAEFGREGGKVGRRDLAAVGAQPQRHLLDFAAQVLERGIFQVDIIKRDVAVRQFHLDILDIQRVISEVDIGGKTFERETAALVKRQALDADIKIVILQSRQGEVGTQVLHRQVVGVELAKLSGLVQDIISERRLPNHHRFDLHVKGLGRLVILGLEGIDDELHVGRAGLVGARHMAIEADDFTIGDDNATVENQVPEADTCTQLPDNEQRVALLVMDQDVLEFQLVEGGDGYRTDIHLGIQVFAEGLFALLAQALLHGRHEQQQIGQRNDRHDSDKRSHHHTSHHVVCPSCQIHLTILPPLLQNQCQLLTPSKFINLSEPQPGRRVTGHAPVTTGRQRDTTHLGAVRQTGTLELLGKETFTESA